MKRNIIWTNATADWEGSPLKCGLGELHIPLMTLKSLCTEEVIFKIRLQIKNFTSIIFTSPNSVSLLKFILSDKEWKALVLSKYVFCVGESTANAVSCDYKSFNNIYVSNAPDRGQESLWELFQSILGDKIENEHVFYPASSESRIYLREKLTESCREVSYIHIYKPYLNDEAFDGIESLFLSGHENWVVLMSSSAVELFFQKHIEWRLKGDNLFFITVGEKTDAKAKSLGFEIDLNISHQDIGKLNQKIDFNITWSAK